MSSYETENPSFKGGRLTKERTAESFEKEAQANRKIHNPETKNTGGRSNLVRDRRGTISKRAKLGSAQKGFWMHYQEREKKKLLSKKASKRDSNG